ncbi:hypothetical protein PCE1_003374 [Barthelona sp. PCE]
MPRVRKFEDDLIIKSYPEGRIFFYKSGFRLINSREKTGISLIESAVKGKDFCEYFEETCQPIQYSFKQKAGTGGYMVFEQNFTDNILTDIDILFFEEITSDDHTIRKVALPFEINNQDRYLASRILPLDSNHLLFFIGENNENHRSLTKCYIFNILTEKNRCLGEYCDYPTSLMSPNYTLLSNNEGDFSIYHYNFCVDDMDESHEPNIVQLEEFNRCIDCFNADCVCSATFGTGFEELIIIDSQRNHVDLLERFPQLKDLKTNCCSGFILFTLTQNVFSALLRRNNSIFIVVHIENGELKTSTGRLGCYDLVCDNIKHIDLTISFHDELCCLYGANNYDGVYGPLKYRSVSNEVMRLDNICPLSVMFDGIAHFNDYSGMQCFFYFKEKKIVIHKSVMNSNGRIQRSYNKLSFHPVGEEHFFMLAQRYDRHGSSEVVKIHWEGSESKPIITSCQIGLNNVGIIAGLPFYVSYNDNGTTHGYLGDTRILELPQDEYFNDCSYSVVGNSACIFCSESINFFQFLIDENDVEVQKHFIFYHDNDVANVNYNPRPLVDTADHQLFVVHKYGVESEVHQLHCLNWETGNFLEPVLIYKYTNDEFEDECERIQGHNFISFVGDSYISVDQGIYKVTIVNGTIETHFFSNSNLTFNGDFLNNLNLPNNVVQVMKYEEETKTMVLKTFNVEQDPESTNPTVETFHLPSFLAEASIVEYHMPNYHSQTNNEAEFL